ncbi:hypothetical protein C7999DRAFT_29101 [Corynascus novoguineensis]|uniref:Uncharacterized protein n=1 Tax=Corynascus novoguineensis TaxID=1126955 RepID=A0AAN7HM62_9PEZI|nr:hypothetical protein C7999DRAFT_29101 [Corynascus novoguineensis]
MAAAAATLEQCIKLCARVRVAVERQKGTLELVKKHSAELSRTRTMIELVEMEESLQTPNVRDVVNKLVQVGQTLQAHLNKMDKMAGNGGRFRGFFRQLIMGQRHHEALEHILRELESTKHDLGVHIQLANVGLTRGIDRALSVSVATVEEVNRQLQAKLGPTHTLRIAKLLEDRPRSNDGTVTLTEDDIAFLSSQELTQPREAHAPTENETSRIIRDNQVSLHALQLNSSIGEFDAWKNVATVRIEGNRATSHGIQLNHPISMNDFSEVLKTLKAVKG